MFFCFYNSWKLFDQLPFRNSISILHLFFGFICPHNFKSAVLKEILLNYWFKLTTNIISWFCLFFYRFYRFLIQYYWTLPLVLLRRSHWCILLFLMLWQWYYPLNYRIHFETNFKHQCWLQSTPRISQPSVDEGIDKPSYQVKE